MASATTNGNNGETHGESMNRTKNGHLATELNHTTIQSKGDQPAGPIKISRTVKEGEPTLIDGLIVEVRRKRRHGGQYRVIVRAAGDVADETECPASPPAAATVIDG